MRKLILLASFAVCAVCSPVMAANALVTWEPPVSGPVPQYNVYQVDSAGTFAFPEYPNVKFKLIGQTNGTDAAPLSLFLSNLGIGVYSVVVTAFDPDGETMESAPSQPLATMAIKPRPSPPGNVKVKAAK